MENDPNMFMVVLLFLLVSGLAFVVIALATSFLRFQMMTESTAADEAGIEGDDKALKLELVRKLTGIKRRRASLTLLMMRVVPAAGATGEPSESIRTEFRDALQRELRNEDTVSRLDKGFGWGVLLVDADRDVSAIIKRLDETARDTQWPEGYQTPEGGWRIGVARSPDDGTTAAGLYEAGKRALDEAMEQGKVHVFASAPAADTPDVPDEGREHMDAIMDERQLIPALRKYIALYRKEDIPVTVIMTDIDHFDRYNNHYGKETGDAILRDFAAFLEKEIREEDLLARCDGDGFIMAMGIAPDIGEQVASRIHAALRRHVFDPDRKKLKLTASFGIAGYPDVVGNASRYLDAADHALRTAKAKGRNTCVRFTTDMLTAAVRSQGTKDVF